MILPEVGAFDAGDPVKLDFSEPIDSSSFEVRVWQTQLDEELEIPEDAEPVVASCSLEDADCDGLSITAVEDDDGIIGAELAFDPAGIGRPGTPLILEVRSGLADRDGYETGVSTYYNIQFRDPNGRFNDRPVPFEDGVFIFSSIIDKPIPAVLTLISDVRVLEDGRFYMAGGEGDEINGAPKTTVDPENLIVDPTEQGWAVHIEGFVKLTEDDRRLLETDPIDIRLPNMGIDVVLEATRLNAEVIKDEKGVDRFEGTLSFERLYVTIGGRTQVKEGGSEALVGYWVPEGKAPENYPLVCGDQCGAIVGLCEVPDNFPPEGVCEPAAEE